MPKPVAWIAMIAVGITGYIIGTRVKAAQNVTKKARKKIKR
ncbi:hypothetical protein N1027_11490 [Herbiconiux sp. CPCC 205763]|uniref:Uncharacterized protein n=1 Tax=Herbiconiux aconitum TaxID=2970913 RepID=A0ABT2GV34_9MICO|nr:hypothetical protein [Herbiconiux aconitum]MCS5718756.1 hypothetical protein [Herbiconiux aconitum]